MEKKVWPIHIEITARQPDGTFEGHSFDVDGFILSAKGEQIYTCVEGMRGSVIECVKGVAYMIEELTKDLQTLKKTK